MIFGRFIEPTIAAQSTPASAPATGSRSAVTPPAAAAGK
jgi:hypothetical protein